MALPDIPDSWFKFLTAVAAFVAAVAASVGVFISHSNGSKIDSGVQVVTQKQDANAEKLTGIETKQDATHAVAEKTAEKVGARK